MKKCLTLFLFLVCLSLTAQDFIEENVGTATFTFVNTSTNEYKTTGNGGTCPTLYLTTDLWGPIQGMDLDIQPHSYETITFNNTTMGAADTGTAYVASVGPLAGGGPQIGTYYVTDLVIGSQDYQSGWQNFSGVFDVNPSDCSITTSNSAAVYTNFTFCLQNNLSVKATATWTYNGSVVQSETLSPGASACWTTPNIEISPTPQNFTYNGTVYPVGTGISTDGNGNLTFTNGSGGASTGGTGSGGDYTPTDNSGGSITNLGGGTISFGTGNNDSVTPNTNAIVWGSPSGSASESTLEKGFDQTHQDLNNILSGENILNNSINNQLTTVTNELGQVITLLYQQTNNDQIPVLISAITNLPHEFPTNNVSVSMPTNLSLSISNFATESTQRGISNLIASLVYNSTNQSTNTSGLTNYLTESTFQNFTNMFSGSNSNSEPALEARILNEVPSSATNSDAATAAASSVFSSALSTLSSTISGFSSPPDVGGDPGHTTIWEMNFCGQQIDLDPVDNFPTVVNFSIGIWDFILVAAYLLTIATTYVKLVQFLATVETGGVPNMDVFAGINFAWLGGMFGGNFVGILVAVIIPAVLLAIWVVAVTAIIAPLSEFIGIYSAISTVFSTASSTTAGAAGVHLLFSFFPVTLAIRLVTARILLYFTMAKVTLLASAASRWLFGR